MFNIVSKNAERQQKFILDSTKEKFTEDERNNKNNFLE